MTTNNNRENQMSNPNTITIDDTRYVREDSIPTPAGPPTPTRIVVANRGWVFVGKTTENEDGSLTITDAKCIRRWGTDEKKPGLGYLALHGPTSKTVLDASGTLRIPVSSVVLTMDVADEGAWS